MSWFDPTSLAKPFSDRFCLSTSNRTFLEQAQARFLQQTGDPVTAQQLAWQALEAEVRAKGMMIFDCIDHAAEDAHFLCHWPKGE